MEKLKVLMHGVAVLIFISQTNADEISIKRRGIHSLLALIPGIDRQYSCKTSYNSKIIGTSQELRDYLNTSVSVGGGAKGIEFSASVGYEKEVTSIDKSHLTKIESSATCQYFLAYFQISPEKKPCFSSDFKSKVNQLVSEVKNGGIKDSTAYGIFENFGTHYLIQALYGAKYTYMFTMTTSSYNKMVKEGVNVAAAVSYASKKASGSIGVDVATEKETKFSKFEENTQYTTYSYGSVPPSNKDPTAWASQVRLHPQPIEYKVGPISDLFDASKFNSKCIKDMFASENDRASIKKGLEDKLKTYCQHLKSQGTRVYCSEGEIPKFDRSKPTNDPTYRGLIWPTAANY